MRNPLRRRKRAVPLTITLRLRRIEDLFAAPDASPFDPDFAPYSFGPAIDYVVAEMQRFPDATTVNLTILLPANALAAEPAAEERTREAIGRYARAWSASQEQQRDVGLRRRGRDGSGVLGGKRSGGLACSGRCARGR